MQDELWPDKEERKRGLQDGNGGCTQPERLPRGDALLDERAALEQAVLDELHQLTIPLEIAPHATCFGKTYYEWWARTKQKHGIAPSLPEAIRDALNAILPGD